jgi:spore germination protein KB
LEFYTYLFFLFNLTKNSFALQSKILKTGVMAVLFAGMYFTLNMLLLISVLGTDVLSRSAFPALKAASFIDIAGIIQRLDSFVIILVVFLGFIKVAMF